MEKNGSRLYPPYSVRGIGSAHVLKTKDMHPRDRDYKTIIANQVLYRSLTAIDVGLDVGYLLHRLSVFDIRQLIGAGVYNVIQCIRQHPEHESSPRLERKENQKTK